MTRLIEAETTRNPLRSLRATLLALSLPLLLAGCAAIDYSAKLAELSDLQRAAAYRQYELSRYDAALKWVRNAMQSARRLPATSVQVVEAYDDAGLYYYRQNKFKQSARHQAIAVLLALDNPDLAAMLPIYLECLSWAWAKYRPDEDFTEALYGFQGLFAKKV